MVGAAWATVRNAADLLISSSLIFAECIETSHFRDSSAALLTHSRLLDKSIRA
jgi:hypothetical protein